MQQDTIAGYNHKGELVYVEGSARDPKEVYVSRRFVPKASVIEYLESQGYTVQEPARIIEVGEAFTFPELAITAQRMYVGVVDGSDSYVTHWTGSDEALRLLTFASFEIRSLDGVLLVLPE